MTPTLIGRWQTRLLLFLAIGLPVTVLVAFDAAGWAAAPAAEPFLFLATLLAVGLVLDPVYFQMQRFRWDGDWPFVFFTFFSFAEFLIVVALMRGDLLAYLPSCRRQGFDATVGAVVCQAHTIPFSTALWHFLAMFVPMLGAVLAGIQVFLVRWRFKGGELGRFPVSE